MFHDKEQPQQLHWVIFVTKGKTVSFELTTAGPRWSHNPKSCLDLWQPFAAKTTKKTIDFPQQSSSGFSSLRPKAWRGRGHGAMPPMPAGIVWLATHGVGGKQLQASGLLFLYAYKHIYVCVCTMYIYIYLYQLYWRIIFSSSSPQIKFVFLSTQKAFQKAFSFRMLGTGKENHLLGGDLQGGPRCQQPS